MGLLIFSLFYPRQFGFSFLEAIRDIIQDPCHVGVELGVWGLSFHGIPIGAMQLVCFGVVVQGCTVQTLGLWG